MSWCCHCRCHCRCHCHWSFSSLPFRPYPFASAIANDSAESSLLTRVIFNWKRTNMNEACARTWMRIARVVGRISHYPSLAECDAATRASVTGSLLVSVNICRFPFLRVKIQSVMVFILSLLPVFVFVQTWSMWTRLLRRVCASVLICPVARWHIVCVWVGACERLFVLSLVLRVSLWRCVFFVYAFGDFCAWLRVCVTCIFPRVYALVCYVCVNCEWNMSLACWKCS